MTTRSLLLAGVLLAGCGTTTAGVAVTPATTTTVAPMTTSTTVPPTTTTTEAPTTEAVRAAPPPDVSSVEGENRWLLACATTADAMAWVYVASDQPWRRTEVTSALLSTDVPLLRSVTGHLTRNAEELAFGAALRTLATAWEQVSTIGTYDDHAFTGALAYVLDACHDHTGVWPGEIATSLAATR